MSRVNGVYCTDGTCLHDRLPETAIHFLNCEQYVIQKNSFIAKITKLCEQNLVEVAALIEADKMHDILYSERDVLKHKNVLFRNKHE